MIGVRDEHRKANGEHSILGVNCLELPDASHLVISIIDGADIPEAEVGCGPVVDEHILSDQLDLPYELKLPLSPDTMGQERLRLLLIVLLQETAFIPVEHPGEGVERLADGDATPDRPLVCPKRLHPASEPVGFQ